MPEVIIIIDVHMRDMEVTLLQNEMHQIRLSISNEFNSYRSFFDRKFWPDDSFYHAHFQMSSRQRAC